VGTGTVANWLVAMGTFVVAAVAVFQETIRGWFYRPEFQVSITGEPPDCVSVPFSRLDGTFTADCIYLRVCVENVGNATANNAEVYARELRRRRLSGEWERVGAGLEWGTRPNLQHGIGTRGPAR
jgi:hypothetical protein